MPNALGQYSLFDMEDRVRRLLNSIQAVVDQTTGAESNPKIQGQLVSNTDITNQINSALVGIYMEMIVGRENLFSSTVYLSTQANYLGPYTFPPNMYQLRYMLWLPPTPVPPPAGNGPPFPFNPNRWIPMAMVDDPNDYDMIQHYSAPTWRWDGDGFRLNSVVQQDNPNGIQLNMTSWPAELVNQTDVINARFFRLAQQVVIYDAAFTLAWSKLKQVTDEIKDEKALWHQRLMTACENAYATESVQATTTRFVQNTYSGRNTCR